MKLLFVSLFAFAQANQMSIFGLGMSEIDDDNEWFCYAVFLVPSMHNQAHLNRVILSLLLEHVIPKRHPVRNRVFKCLKGMLCYFHDVIFVLKYTQCLVVVHRSF